MLWCQECRKSNGIIRKLVAGVGTSEWNDGLVCKLGIH